MPQRTIRFSETTRSQIDQAVEQGGFSTPTAFIRYAVGQQLTAPGRARRRQWRRGAPGGESGATPPRGRSVGSCTAGVICVFGHVGKDNPDVYAGAADGCQAPGSGASQGAI
jgi:Arc/MetJ-type ribon-helix-helix transcriptional regulator